MLQTDMLALGFVFPGFENLLFESCTVPVSGVFSLFEHDNIPLSSISLRELFWVLTPVSSYIDFGPSSPHEPQSSKGWIARKSYIMALRFLSCVSVSYFGGRCGSTGCASAYAVGAGCGLRSASSSSAPPADKTKQTNGPIWWETSSSKKISKHGREVFPLVGNAL